MIFIFSSIAKCASFLADKILGKGEDGINEEEIKLMIDIGTNEGTLEENERALLYKIFKFGDLHAHDIMKHRSLVKALPVTSCTKDVIAMIEHSNFSRIPLYEKSLDKIVGVIDYKTILYEDEKNLDDKSFVTKKMKTPLFLPETFTAIEVLLKLKKSNEDFAIVLDEQGVTAGIITIDDIMRVVFERLTDENAEINEKPEERIKIIQKNEYIIPGDMSLDDVNALTFLSLTSESFNTFGGYVLEKFGYLPVVGEAFKDKTGTYIIEDVARRRIVSVRVKLHAN
ncbi:MAG: CBS domain-containing protein [Treponema sp.]|nr:CBS domain-containing protein [Treponema sp.]